MLTRLPRRPDVLLTAALAAAAALRPAPGHAQQAARAPTPPATTPNFSGTWAFDSARSDFGGLRSPARLVMRVRHVGTALEVTVAGGPAGGVDSSTTAYVVGAPAVTTGHPWGRTWTRAAVDGRAIVLADSVDGRNLESTRKDRWVLAPDGRTLTVNRVVAVTTFAPDGTVPYMKTTRSRLVFARQ